LRCRIVNAQKSAAETHGFYADGELADVLIRGSVAVQLADDSTPQAGTPVHLSADADQSGRTLAADGGTALNNLVFTTGIVQGGVCEVTITERRI